MKRDFLPKLVEEFPGVGVRWEGQQERETESFGSMAAGFLVALLAMFVLLSMEFRSYVQPLLILMIIPFGAVGAIIGHGLMGFPLCFFSVFGLIALSGIIVNDSIVLFDFINARIAEGGVSPRSHCRCRNPPYVRPVILTSTDDRRRVAADLDRNVLAGTNADPGRYQYRLRSPLRDGIDSLPGSGQLFAVRGFSENSSMSRRANCPISESHRRTRRSRQPARAAAKNGSNERTDGSGTAFAQAPPCDVIQQAGPV